RSLLLLVCAAVIVSPYVAWLSINSGYLRLEGKSDSNGLVNERMETGMSVFEASRGIGPDLEPAGPDLIQNQFEIPRLKEPGLVVALKTVFDEPVNRASEVIKLWLGYDHSGNVLLGVLALAGMLSLWRASG